MKLTLEDFPKSLRDIVDLIGLPAALRLVDNFGGIIALYVPRKIGADHQLAMALGLPAARKLASYYGGDYLCNIPRYVRGLRRVRNAEIRRRRREGDSAQKLARAFFLTERQIWTILGEADDSVHERNLPFANRSNYKTKGNGE